jgi:hypothetical protein
MPKIIEINLESGMPTVDTAIQNMKNSLTACKRRGFKAVILIHGYGSSGVGGGIKAAVKRCLADSSMQGIVRDAIGGEQWHYRKRELLTMYRDLAGYEGRIASNEGVTIVILK